MAQASRPCKGCGELIYRTRPTGEIRHYCSPNCRPRCSVHDCGKPRHGNVYCTAHHTRWKRTGDPLTPKQRGRNEGDCTVEGCGQPMRKKGWCASHYAQQQRTGQPPVPFGYKWGDGASPCPNCGSPDHARGQRVFCSSNCQVAFKFYGGPRPRETNCVACGVVINLNARGRRGQLTNATIKFCRRCRQDYDKYKMSARELAVRDGTDCGICGHTVDMTLRRRDSLMCPSVDHVVPRSRGGSHEPENLQLAHLHCNQAKSDRVPDSVQYN